jgi:biotin carboxyl carrier protein
MKLEIQFGGKTHIVESLQADGDTRWMIDGRATGADAAGVTSNVYSILIAGQSLEARVEKAPGPSARVRVLVAGHEYVAEMRDPRQWRRHRGSAVEVEGAQHVIAPMPGKIVRVLVKAGDEVNAGQGIAVVEAMKMQNEVRAPKSGKVERVSVAEGQTVGAGDVIAVVQ